MILKSENYTSVSLVRSFNGLGSGWAHGLGVILGWS
jgi:hypothetical protein